jgi:hypothetical protein
LVVAVAVGGIGSFGGGAVAAAMEEELVAAAALEEELVAATAVETLAAAGEEHKGARAGEERIGLGRYF